MFTSPESTRDKSVPEEVLVTSPESTRDKSAPEEVLVTSEMDRIRASTSRNKMGEDTQSSSTTDEERHFLKEARSLRGTTRETRRGEFSGSFYRTEPLQSDKPSSPTHTEDVGGVRVLGFYSWTPTLPSSPGEDRGSRTRAEIDTLFRVTPRDTVDCPCSYSHTRGTSCLVLFYFYVIPSSSRYNTRRPLPPTP